MVRYTTPTLALYIDCPDIADAKFYVSIRQKQCEAVLTVDNVTVSTTQTGIKLDVPLAQLQTAGFTEGSAEIQVNWIDDVGVRGATAIARINITDNLLDRVISYGGGV